MPADSLLVVPSSAQAASYQAACAEGYQPDPSAPSLDGTDEALDAHIAWLNAQEGLIRMPDGSTAPRVPHQARWLAAGDIFIGRVNIRLRLTPALERWGGHIGYAIRPSFQRRGFGMRILSLALPLARAHGLQDLLLTCLDTNLGSIRIIEAHGGELIETIPHPYQDNQTSRRYRIAG